MAVNFFNNAMGVIDAGNEGWDQSQKRFDRFTTNRAGAQLAGGDRAGASKTFARGGLVDQSRILDNDAQADERLAMQDRQAAEQREYQRGRDQRTDARQEKTDERQDRDAAIKDAELRLEVLKAVGGKVMKNPMGSRKPVLDRGLQLFESVGYPPQVIEKLRGLTEEQLGDDGVMAVIAAGEEELVKLTGGGLGAWNPQTREYRELVKPSHKLGQGQVLFDGEGNPIANVPKTYAPARSGSGRGRAPAANGGDAALQAIEAELRRRGAL